MSSTSKIVPNIMFLSMCECGWLVIFRDRHAGRPCDYLSGRATTDFPDIAGQFPRDGLPESRGNSSAPTAKQTALQPRHHAVPDAKQTHHHPCKSIGDGC